MVYDFDFAYKYLVLRKSKRKRASIDYVALHEGESVITDQHPYCELIRNGSFREDTFTRVRGSDLTRHLAEADGVTAPVVVSKEESAGLDLSIPESLTVRKVVELVGPEGKVEVIDVPTQHEVPNWNLQKWADYYELPAENRDRVRNVISLEVTGTKLGDMILRPKFVRSVFSSS